MAALALGRRKPSHLATHPTIANPTVEGADSLGRVTCPQGGVRPRLGLGGVSPMRDSVPSAAAGQDRTTISATPVLTTGAAHVPERRMRRSAQDDRCGGS